MRRVDGVNPVIERTAARFGQAIVTMQQHRLAAGVIAFKIERIALGVGFDPVGAIGSRLQRERLKGQGRRIDNFACRITGPAEAEGLGVKIGNPIANGRKQIGRHADFKIGEALGNLFACSCADRKNRHLFAVSDIADWGADHPAVSFQIDNVDRGESETRSVLSAIFLKSEIAMVRRIADDHRHRPVAGARGRQPRNNGHESQKRPEKKLVHLPLLSDWSFRPCQRP